MQWTLSQHANNESLVLPKECLWIDEQNWRAIESTEEYSVAGALIEQQGVKLAGRPITLDGQKAHVKKAIVDKLREWSDLPELKMTLTHFDGRTFDVSFAKEALNAEPVFHRSPNIATDPYRLTLRLKTIQRTTERV